jgi:hypothetical protein
MQPEDDTSDSKIKHILSVLLRRQALGRSVVIFRSRTQTTEFFFSYQFCSADGSTLVSCRMEVV